MSTHLDCLTARQENVPLWEYFTLPGLRRHIKAMAVTERGFVHQSFTKALH